MTNEVGVDMISLKGVAALGGIAVFSAVSAVGPASPVSAQDLYAAIAYSPSKGVVGGSTNYPTREGADERAMGECVSHPKHAGDCEIVTSSGKGCVALALGPTTTRQHSSGYGATIQEAEKLAMSHSRGSIKVRICNDGGEPAGASSEFGDEVPR